MWSELFARHWISLHGLVTTLALGVYLATSHARKQRRHPSAAIAWFLSLALMPYLALPLYLLRGSRKMPRSFAGPRGQAKAVAAPTAGLSRTQTLVSTLGLPPASTYDHFELHEDGHEARQSLMAMIDGATTTLDICVFVMGHDVLGQEVAWHLIQSAQKGVQVRLLVDGVGAYLGGRVNWRALTKAGVHVTRFVSPFFSPLPGRSNLRNHRKMVIADGHRVWMGGRNLAAEYFEGDPGLRHARTPWTDLSFVLSGAVALQAQNQFQQDWTLATQAHPAEPTPAPDLAVASPSVQWLPSGPDQIEDTLYTVLVSSCFSAQKRIMAVSPYFVPDPTLQMALTLAARRGVLVDLVLPQQSNHRLADMARHAALRELTSAGARVWLMPEMVHAKALVVDDQLALAGSANLDERSLFLNYEVMVAFYKSADIEQFAQWIAHRRQRALPYKAQEPDLMRELLEGAVRWLAFQL